MKDAPSSRGFAATNSAEPSNGSSTETIRTETEILNGSSIGSIDPNDTSFFIQYQPELAEKLSQHTSTYSVSGRCLSIVFSRMLYWSRYAKHRYNGKLFYWKNQTEISEETGFSVKQINRALKVLVELGLLIREKFQKHRYYQCYFYHIPTSPHTKELKPPARTSSRSRSSTRRIHSSGSVGSQPQQQFHRSALGSASVQDAPKPIRSISAAPSTRTTAVDPSGAAPAPPAGSGATTGSVQQKPAETSSTIHKSRGFRTIGTKGSDHSTKISSSIKQTLLNIVEKCEMYGREDIYRERFGIIA
jgi:hypothetical protein